MKVVNQIKNDKNNIFGFLKYVSDLENNSNIFVFFENQYNIYEINKVLQKDIEYHSMFNNFKFDIWFLKNSKRLENSIIFLFLKEFNSNTEKHIMKLRKYSEEILVQFDSNVKIEDVKKFADKINKNIIVGYSNYDTKELRKVCMFLGKKFEYKKINNNLKALAIIHTYNEEDVIEKTIKYLLDQSVDIYLLDNWSTDKTFKIEEKLQEKYPDRIILKRYPEEEPKEKFYDWTSQLHQTEKISKMLNYDWYIHYDSDEIRVTPFGENISLSEMIKFVDSLGYNAINTTVLDFRMTSENDNIFSKDTYFEIGRKPTHFMQIKTWKKCEDIDLASTGGHIAKFENQKVYPLKMINKHYPLRNLEQAEKKIYKDRLPRFEKEKKEKGWHCHYDKMAEDRDFIYEKENLNKYDKNILEKLTFELISGIGIDKI